MAFKKAKKVGWHALNITESEVATIEQRAAMELSEPIGDLLELTEVVSLTEPLSRTEQAHVMFMANNWVGLWNFKKRTKVSWMSLGFTNTQIQKITRYKPE